MHVGIHEDVQYSTIYLEAKARSNLYNHKGGMLNHLQNRRQQLKRGCSAYSAVETGLRQIVGKKAIQCTQCNFCIKEIHEAQIKKKSSDSRILLGSREGACVCVWWRWAGGNGSRGTFSLSAWFASPAITMECFQNLCF